MLRNGFTVAALSAALLIGACVSDPEKKDAIHAVNDEFRKNYEELVEEEGTRTYDATEDQAFVAMENSLRNLGMRIEAQDSKVGYIRSAAPAPKPLTTAEWEETSQKDLEEMRHIIVGIVGMPGYFVKFEPQGLEIVINVTMEKRSDEVEVSVTMRMRETKPPKTGWPRREYPPPTSIRLGFNKFWDSFDRELDRIKSIQ